MTKLPARAVPDAPADVHGRSDPSLGGTSASGATSAAPAATAPRPPRCGVDVLDAIWDRRAVRAYLPRQVADVTVQTLLGAAVQAPSAVNQQPWAFVVVRDRAVLERLSRRAKELTLAALGPTSPLQDHRAMLADPSYDVFHGAPTLIVLCAAPGEWPANEDCCLAAENLMLAAHGLGLGTCPIGLARAALNEPRARRELGIPDDHSAVLPIVVGHRAESPPAPERRPPRILSWVPSRTSSTRFHSGSLAGPDGSEESG